VFFGATVTVCHGDGVERTYSIVGVEEADVNRGHISWVSPLARALLKARPDDEIRLMLPNGIEEIVVAEVNYLEIS
jgi:transcription elongation factor GreB